MKSLDRHTVLTALAASALPLPVLAAFPNKPLRIVVPYSPGGGGDTQVRVLTEKGSGFSFEDFTPVAGLSSQPMFITVPGNSPFGRWRIWWHA